MFRPSAFCHVPACSNYCFHRLYHALHSFTATTINEMAILDAYTLSQIMSQALALPPDTNPYLWLSDFMATEVVPNLSTRPLRIILWLAVASHAIALLCNIAVIVFRVKAGHFWVVRFTRSEDGKYLTCVDLFVLLARLTRLGTDPTSLWLLHVSALSIPYSPLSASANWLYTCCPSSKRTF